MKYCQKCGKELMDGAVICPGCGCATQSKKIAETTVPKKAKTAMIFGILSLLIFSPLGIPAIIFANQSKKETGGVMCKQAKTGFVCGVIALSFWGMCIAILLLGGN